MRLAIFYHALFFQGPPPVFLPNALAIVFEQMNQLQSSGLLDACDEMVFCCNGGKESLPSVNASIPSKARLVMHGLECKTENLTIYELEKWAPEHPGWFVLYLHAKGATHPHGSPYGETISKPWRQGMMQDLVTNWRRCVWDLESGYDIACSFWLWNMCDGTQHLPEGNFLWVKSDFVAKLPSILERDRIKVSGIGSPESRWEAEVHWGNGPRPKVKQYRSHGWSGVR